MKDEELARLKRMTVAAGSVLGASVSIPVTTLNALIAEVERLRIIEARVLDYQRKCCPHGFRYHAECPECCE